MPGGDLGFQGLILVPKTGRKGTLGAPFWDGCWILLLSVFEVLFWKASGLRFWRFWDSGLSFGVVFVTCWTQTAGLHKIMKNEISVIIYYTSGMSRIPKTMLFRNMFSFF